MNGVAFSDAFEYKKKKFYVESGISSGASACSVQEETILPP